MSWNGIVIGAFVGFLITRSAWGALAGAIIGYMLDPRAGMRAAGIGAAGGGTAAISSEFFRTTFEIMGHVAKSDGRVSEAEIDAARRVMQDLNLGPADVAAAIACFGAGKAPGYDASSSIARLRQSCGLRYDLLRAFVDLQLRAALAGNGISPPARRILKEIAARLGLSDAEFVHMEASLRARQSGSRAKANNLAQCYAELEVDVSISDAELVKAYRRQMSRHHPDKLVANGLPESMAQMAKEKTQRIQEAYEALRAARGMR